MPSQDQAPIAGVPDLHMGNIAPFTAKKLAVPGVLILISNEDGTIGMTAHGLNHARANEMLSVGIFMNLEQHYAAIREGHAGGEAREHMEALDNLPRQETVQ